MHCPRGECSRPPRRGISRYVFQNCWCPFVRAPGLLDTNSLVAWVTSDYTCCKRLSRFQVSGGLRIG